MATLFILFLPILPSCEKEDLNSYGFDSDFGKNSRGLTIMGVDHHVGSIRLCGEIIMDSGELKVDFIDPDDYIVYTMNFYAPGTYMINETFKAVNGIWELRYTSLEGNGSIDLHATYRN